ncbi:metal-dependent transcriptional regulator [Paramaledivibacter caminithermalis]|jgi:Mn-dependent DtxR family transcriptional regulator|uniref:Iron (Metal) dependent repressor, DtxR family n=1 Tax=Paramaledivibacter caminithermalis (strain DSM 15212 / CIP 107654 / DViRD3) TaxID=1121301 RepID=A0A1M6KI74_PARC5|nr:iron dependent repressor, metal binding and dimerization domain protein [Paramaledivibacter caminithermalis]SHJ58611.1 iron (metal) dependent repressor, DtxR family [Paramaledivibacter caminithermalis DSM 15212]
MLSPSLEDYLEELYNLYIKNENLRIIDLASKLDVSSPSVVKALKKLHSDGYIIYEKYKGIILTEKGKKLGKSLVKRNDILQEFLVIIDSNCNPEEEAEAMEHYLSPSTVNTFKLLSTFLKENNDVLVRFKEYKKGKGV